MPLKKSAGNMYPWVTHTKSYLGGQCPHLCSYCYVQAMGKMFPNVRKRYSGPVHLVEAELAENLGSKRIIFIEHQNDLFAAGVPSGIIAKVLDHCRAFAGNTYVFQTKNPTRYLDFAEALPAGSILGTTIESDIHHPLVMRDAPPPAQRAEAMKGLRANAFFKLFVTIEPILVCSPKALAEWIEAIRPDFVNIGADSKYRGLPEPSADDVLALIEGIKAAGVEIRQKTNLARLLKATGPGQRR
jgi:DNA repair photolyase